ncbi:MAG: hypothetical protein JWR35_63 [Marmoricola sp.]|nr:hypothetical protein [Marmoricola sp.]
MTHAIEVALGLITEDLVAGGVPLPRIEPSTWQDWEPSESVMLFGADGSGTGVWLDLGLSQAHGLAHLADQVQDWAVEELARLGRPTNWPVCAAHPTNHPLRTLVEDGRAVWACPAGGTAPLPIGEVSSGEKRPSDR